jgi:hypothetical protein
MSAPPPFVDDERGVALPMALIALMIMAVLVAAFSVLSATEPTIASNQLRVAQARALAEAGVERALGALSAGKISPGASGSIPYPLVSAPAPFDGSALVGVSTGGGIVGGFRVTVTNGAAPNERTVIAVGWVPTDVGSDGRTKAHQRITATLMDLDFRALSLPCALCARGDIDLGGRAEIDAREDRGCTDRLATWSAGTTVIGSGAVRVYGADGNSTPNEATDMAMDQAPAVFEASKLSPANLDALRAVARASDTYYRGTVVFDDSNTMPDGVVFVDTATGAPIDPGTTPASDDAAVDVRGGAARGAGNVFRGWLIVNGSLRISGDIEVHGLVYAVSDFSYARSGGGGVVGQVISAGVRDSRVAIADTSDAGGSSIRYHCGFAKGGDGTVPRGFMMKAGSYREVSDP